MVDNGTVSERIYEIVLLISVICNLGENHKIVGGQFVRSQNICEYLISNMSESVNIVDISSCTRYQLFSGFLKSLASSRRIVIIPGPNLLRLVAWISVIGFARKFVIVAVGGWIPEVARDDKRVLDFLRKVNSVWVQTAGLQSSLKTAGVRANLLLNFKNGLVPIRPSRHDSPRLKVVFFSRVSEQKGIFEAIEAVSHLAELCDLDIYGPLHECSLDLQNIKNVRYLGVLSSDEIQLRLSSYDLLLFPTYYPGEGFPGVLIDAFFSGITVIASNWKFNIKH